MSHPQSLQQAPRAPWIVLTLLSVLAVAGVYLLAVLSESGQRWEDTALTAADYPGSWFGLLNLVSIPVIAIVTVLAAVVALARRRPGLAARAVLIVGISTLTGQLLKHGVLDRPDLSEMSTSNSFPSGHIIVVTALWIAIATVLPPIGRRIALILAVPFAAAVSAQLIGYGWHRLSDVIGGVLIVVAASALTTAIWPDTVHDRTVRPADRALRVALRAVVILSVLGSVVLFGVYRAGHSYDPTLLLLAAQLLSVAVVSAALTLIVLPWRTPRRPQQPVQPSPRVQEPHPVLSGR